MAGFPVYALAPGKHAGPEHNPFTLPSRRSSCDGVRSRQLHQFHKMKKIQIIVLRAYSGVKRTLL
jgi:hypothetical protein